MSITNNSRRNESEIINQKKKFIFEVEQTSDYVFPNEEFKYYVYIKNISGVQINNFNIKIENSPNIIFHETDNPNTFFNLDIDEVKLYELKASSPIIGTHTVHFIGYGEETQILYKTLKINCTRTYNSDTMLHRLHIYDFTPYENNYTMEASNFNEGVTQTTKVQKLPYKAGKQPFPLLTKEILDKRKNSSNNKIKVPFSDIQDFIPENIESESFLSQYYEAKNTKEHVYQYISRENFTEDSIESYTGENLYEIFEKINENSEYFRGKFLKSGTNHLLNDFTQYSPNGFLYRMGLLNSEIYHNLGVIPTYSYMSDRLFRWAPSEKQPLNLIPEKRAMKWGENIWAGRGFLVYKEATEEYQKTEEYAKKIKDNLIKQKELINCFEEEKTAQEFVSNLEYLDDIQRTYKRSNLIKYEYTITESLYDTGVFFVNIPIDKIPSNFYLMNNENLQALINRAKPYGTKPIINYIIERTFNHHIDQSLLLNYYKNFNFNMDSYDMLGDNEIIESEYGIKTIECEGKTIEYPAFIPKNIMLFRNFTETPEIELDVDYSKIGMSNTLDLNMEEETYICETTSDYRLHTLEDIFEVLYQGNYNNISFKLNPKNYNNLNLTQNDLIFNENSEGDVILKNPIESLKFNIINRNKDFNKGNTEINMVIEDSDNKKHKISASYDKDLKMDCIKYTYINKKNQEFVREKGYQNVNAVAIIIGKIYNKKILLFMVEDDKRFLHYFHHVIVQDILTFNSNKIIEGVEQSFIKNVLFAYNILNKNIIFETPFIKKSKTFQPKLLEGGENWNNLYRLNEKTNSYSYIRNLTNNFLSVDDINLYYDQINLPETAIIDRLRFKIIGTSSASNNIHIKDSFNTNYKTNNVIGNKIQLIPNKIECYSNLNESSAYYQAKLDASIKKGQDSFIKLYTELLDENYIFNEDIDIDILDYINHPNDFITIDNPFWYEISEFTTLSYNLNEIGSINFIIEGYNTEYETNICVETLSDIENSSTVKQKIPSGYFREKINLLYPNKFLLELLRVRFRFENLNHNIKIFDTKIEVKFKNKQTGYIEFINGEDFDINKKNIITLLEEYYNPSDVNNGVLLKLSFDDLNPGDYYHLNFTELEVIYSETDIDMMINNKKYQDVFYGVNNSGVSGTAHDAYLSGIFYNDVPTMIQNDDNTGLENKGIKLFDTLYQSFETRDDNITSIEIFPYSFVGNPDETLKIGLYTNSYNTPGKLLKEVYINGWVKNNKDLKNLGRIKYNFNINNLEINEKYWFKIQVLNPQENSYYLLKGTNKTKPGFKLLSDENNNYINTFSNLKFNIYSKNLSQSFNSIPALQEYFDNPYVLIGLHKGQGTIENLHTNKYVRGTPGNNHIEGIFSMNSEVEVDIQRE